MAENRLYAFIALTLLLSLSAGAVDDTAPNQQKLEKLHRQIESTEQAIRQAREAKDDVQTDLMMAEKEISRISRRINIIRQDQGLQQERLVQLEEEVVQRQAALAIEQQALAGLIRSAHQMSRHGDIHILLNQENPALFARMMTYHGYFSRQRIRQIDRVNEKLDELAKAQHAAALQAGTLARLQNKQEQEQLRLEQLKEQKQEALQHILADIDNETGLLGRLKKDEQSLRTILESLTAPLDDIPPGSDQQTTFASLKGRLEWPSGGRLIRRYGAQRGNSGKRWSGVVIGSRPGNDVQAVAHGRVAFSDWLRGYGLLIIIDHGDGYMSLYGHNESVFRDTGEWVEAGDVIASVGDSGGQSQAGLYFELRKGGKPLNPVRWCTTKEPPRG